jgi:threonylcarbamoyladenosine tRNA methylthiotransferase MtaB
MQAKTFKIISLGCRTNQYEAQAYRDQLEALGYRMAQDDERAEVCIVNTCTVTAAAEKDSRQAIRRLARHHPSAKLVVTGCAAEGQPAAFAAIAGVTAVVPNAQKEQLLAHLLPDEEELPEFRIRHFEAHTRAFVKVQDGCNSFCTYCVIPYLRGRSRSRDIPSIVQEVEALVANGYQEVVLTGINIGDFDGNKPAGLPPDRLADLVRAVDVVPGLARLRLSSIDPDEVDDALIATLLEGRTTCASLHLVLQSGSNVVLKRMNRKYTRQIFLQTMEKLRAASPDFTVTTDVIVGFPGETESDFAETVEVMREVQFAKVHMFPFSPRPRTRAALLPNQVPAEVVAERKGRLMRTAEQVAFDLRQRYVGRTLSILTEGGERPGLISGHTENFLMAWIPAAGRTTNEIVNVRMLENTPEGLVGTVACR